MSERDYQAEIMAAHAVVWDYRGRLADKWPCPSPDDSLRFAMTEICGESLDAWLRSKPEYVRNNHRVLSVTDELADGAMMLATALGPVVNTCAWQWIATVSVLPEQITLDDIAIQVGHAMTHMHVHDFRDFHMLLALVYIAMYPGMPPLAEAVEARLVRIAAKVGA